MCLKRSSSPENGRASLTMTFLRAARRASISALILSIDVARNAGAGVDARRPAGRSVRGLVMVFSFFFAGEARHRDVDDEGGRPVGRAVPAHAHTYFSSGDVFPHRELTSGCR